MHSLPVTYIKRTRDKHRTHLLKKSVPNVTTFIVATAVKRKVFNSVSGPWTLSLFFFFLLVCLTRIVFEEQKRNVIVTSSERSIPITHITSHHASSACPLCPLSLHVGETCVPSDIDCKSSIVSSGFEL
jgi:hypothetical protein